MSWKFRLILGAFLIAGGLVAWAALARYLAPASNSSLTRFDAIIVLGYPADNDGNPTPIQLSRVTEAVHEYERGIAPRIIVSGGAAHNGLVEAEVMARTAKAEGIPASAIIVEGQAKDTIQNACYSARIMKSHGWRSAEVVSTGSHLPRAAMIFDELPLEWRMHAAPLLTPHHGRGFQALAGSVETLKTARYLIWARYMERCEP
jgi:uncharacterized SAM-binding protein YcdF (DUF218 family)